MYSYENGYNSNYYISGNKRNYYQGQFYKGKNKIKGKPDKNTYNRKEDNYINPAHQGQSIYKDQSHQIEKQRDEDNQIGKIDPYTAQMLIYRAEMYVVLNYPHFIDINDKSVEKVKEIKENSFFYVIKSFSEEDVHKAVKYNVWTSTKAGNNTLSNSYKFASQNGSHVFLFFSCNRTGRFVGIARMKSDVDSSLYFPLWTQDNKWGGLFDLEWIFIKDIPFTEFEDVIFTLRDGETKCVTYSRNTQEIPFSDGVRMVEIFKKYSNTNTILEHFEYYDLRQEKYEKDNQKIGQATFNYKN